jgi:hypothetical protein
MKRILTLICTLLTTQILVSQTQTLCDFEGAKMINFGFRTGTIDTVTANPAPDATNMSTTCAKYVRDSALYDFIRMYPVDNFVDVTAFAANGATTPKIKMKIWTSAPVGTPLTLQLGTQSDESYPGGVHSEYVSTTTVQNGWHTVTFNFWQSGSWTNGLAVDKIVLLFNPGSNDRDTVYIDDIIGPQVLIVSGLASTESAPFKLYQNSPNPVKNLAHINFQLGTGGTVSLKLYDMLGNPVKMIVDSQYMKPGTYTLPVHMEDIRSGIYFYVLRKDGVEKSMKMIVSK